MALQYVGGTSNVGTSTGYTVSLNGTLTGGIASSPAQGDIVVVVSAFSNNASSAPAVSGNTSGAYQGAHTAIWQTDTWGTNFRVFYQVMGSTPDTTLTITRVTNAAYGGATTVQVWRGVDTSNPLDVTTTTAQAGNASRPNPPAITPTNSGAVIIACGAGSQGASGSAFTSFSSMSNAISVKSDGTTSDIGVLMASLAWTSGAYDPAAATGGATSTSSSWAAATLALRAAIVNQNFTQTVAGTITAVGTLTDKISIKRLYTSSLTLAGSLVSNLVTGTLYTKALSSVLTLTGVIRRKTATSKKVGSITPTATISRRMAFRRIYSSSMALSGSIRRNVSKRYTGVITAVGIIRKKITRRLTSSLTMAGIIRRRIVRRITGVITASATYSARVVIQRLYSSSITMSGASTNGGAVTPVPDPDKASVLSFLRRFIGRR